MNFFAPQYFYGLFALFIPIVVHLFNFRRSRKVYFSSTRFIQIASEKTNAKKNLKHLLILISRMLFLFFIIMAFAKPYIPAKNTEMHEYVQIYLDNSFSMSNESEEGVTSLDQAVQVVHSIINSYPSSAKFRLILNDFSLVSGRFRSAQELKDALTELTLNDHFKTNEMIYLKFKDAEQEISETDNYWISDFQKVTSTYTKIDSLSELRLIKIHQNAYSNIYMDTLYISNPFDVSSEKLTLTGGISNNGSNEIKNYLVTLTIDGNQVAATNVNIPSNSTAEVNFDLDMVFSEDKPGVIQFEDAPVNFDNQFFFQLPKRSKIKVVELLDRNNNADFNVVYGNDQLFEYRKMWVDQLNFEILNNADLIFLNQIEDIPNFLSSNLKSFMRNGGTVCLVPAINFKEGNINELLPSFNGIPSDSIRSISISPPNTKHPFFKGVFEEEAKNVEMPWAQPLFDQGRGGEPIIQYVNGDYFLTKYIANGSFYLFSGSLSEKNSNFKLHSLFVPVMYRIALQSKSDNSMLYTKKSNNDFSIKVDSLGQNAIYHLTKSDVDIIPSQRLIGSNLIVEMNDLEIESGNYQLEIDQNKVGAIAINYNKSESVLNQLENEEILEYFAGGKTDLLNIENTEENNSQILSDFQPTLLWKWALLISILFVLIEILLIRFLR